MELPDIKDPKNYYQRGYYFYRQNEFDRAIEDYTCTIQLNSKDESVYFWRGRAWAEKGNSKQAVEDWKKSIQLDWHNALHLYYIRRSLKSPNYELDRLIKDTAIQHLTDLDIVDGYAVYYSARPGDLYTVSLILSQPFEEEKFLNMVKDDNPVIRALALISLAREDIKKYEQIIHSFYADTVEVEYVPSGCGVTRITLGKLAKNIISDPNLLDCWAPERTNWKYNTNDDFDYQYRQQERINFIHLLLKKGAEVNVKDKNGETPLHYSASYGHANISEYLITHGAEINIQNNIGETPLHTAVYWGYKDIIELMIKKGADLNIKDENGKTALKTAIEMNYRGLSELLREHGATE
jgi:tetratricopeptide (TPR) repeat protein